MFVQVVIFLVVQFKYSMEQVAAGVAGAKQETVAPLLPSSALGL